MRDLCVPRSRYSRTLALFASALVVSIALPPPACLLGAAALAAGSMKDGPSEVAQILRVSPATHEALRKGTLEAKDRKAIAVGALSRYLNEYLSAGGASEAKAKPFVQSALKDFSKFVPSYRVEPLDAPEVRAIMFVSTEYLISQLEKQGIRASGGNATLNALAPSNAARASAATLPAAGSGNSVALTAKAPSSLPYTALLVDEKNHAIYVSPPEALSSYALDSGEGFDYKLFPAAVIKAVNPSESDLNSVSSPLATRAAQFSNKILFHLQNRALVYKPEWTKQVLAFLETSARVARDRDAGTEKREPRSWPPALPWSLSSLYTAPGFVAVFTVRSNDKSGVLERVELVSTQGGKLHRQYWSRAIHDPGYLETAALALEKAAAGFARLGRVKRPEAQAGALGFLVDKRVSDKDVVAVESILRTFALGEDALLIPSEVTASDVRYASPVPSARADRVLERIRNSVPGVSAKLASGEPPVILLAPQGSVKVP